MSRWRSSADWSSTVVERLARASRGAPRMKREPLQIVLEVHEHGDDNRQACDACGKPVAVRYEVQTADGSVHLLCKSDRDRNLRLAAAARHKREEAEPLFAGD